MGLVALASSEQTVLEVNVYIELAGRAQMMNTDEIQVAPESVFSETTASRSGVIGIITCDSLHGRRGRAVVLLPKRRRCTGAAVRGG